ncbi:MAG: alpha-ketoglutarate-dependent dioxygenase AlkB family protein [Candidatus Kapaibacterium sp.]|jgi:alkylated DNA repair dioxygenase AlkB
MDLFNFQNTELPFQLPQEEGYHCEFNSDFNFYVVKVPNGEIIYAENFFDKKISDRSLEYFLENDSFDWKTANWREFDKQQLEEVKFKNINWHHDKLDMYGKEVFLPRYSAWYGDNDKSYSYSGLILQPNKWNKGLLFLKVQIEKLTKVTFNSVLMNWYRDGEDYINWHTDSEKELGQNPIIASLNFGATRRFLIRRIDDNSIKLEFPLKHGTLLVMKGELQHFWQHSVPKEKKVKQTRINLTFRTIT